MKKWQAKLMISLVAGIVIVIALSPSAKAFELGARGYYWFPTIQSDIRIDGSTIRGTEFNLLDTLALGSEAYPAIEVFAGLGKNHLSLMYTQADYSGSATLSRQIIFNGTTFPAGTAVNSNFKIKMLDLAYKRDLVAIKNILAGFSFSLIGKIKHIEGDAQISSNANSAAESFRLPIPLIGAGAHVGLLANILEARAELTGIAYNSNYLYDASADLSWTPLPFIDLHGGYKIIGIHIDHKDLFFTPTIAGPYIALTVSF